MAKYWLGNNPNAQITNAELTELATISETDFGVVSDLTVTAAEINASADANLIAPAVQTATAALDATARCIKLLHNSVVIAITGPSGVALAGQQMFITNVSASGTAAHTVTLAAGTYDGTNNTATLNAPGETLHVWFDSAGAGCIIANVGSVGLSSV
tara:strand:- start:101 stop:571 length:471 start_codon:yes stop_codon:yes gene_type:complete